MCAQIKKQKLAEIKRSQEAQRLQGGTGPLSAADVASVREEQTKLGKQLRIQNKAKFVSKRIKEADSPAAAEQALQPSMPPASLALPAAASSLAPVTEDRPEAMLSSEVVQEIKNLTSETELRDLQKQVMIEKRKLRLEMRQSDDAGANAESISTKLNELTAKENLVLQQIERVVHLEDDASHLASKSSSQPQRSGGQPDPADSSAASGADLGSILTDKPSSGTPTMKKLPSKTSVRNLSGSRLGSGSLRPPDVFEQAEGLLRQVNALVALEEPPPSVSGANRSGVLSRTSSRNIQQSTIMLELQVSELLKRMPGNADLDPVGYRDKLSAALKQLEKLRTRRPGSDATAAAVTAGSRPAPPPKALLESASTPALPSAAEVVVAQLPSKLVPAASSSSSAVAAVPPTAALAESGAVVEVRSRRAPAADASSSSRKAAEEQVTIGVEERRIARAAPAAAAVGGAVLQEEVTERRQAAVSSSASVSTRLIEANREESVLVDKSKRGGRGAEASVASSQSMRLQVDEETVTTSEDISDGHPAAAAAAGADDGAESLVEWNGEEFVGDVDIEEDPFAKIPGWTESLNTTMKSSAHHAAFYGFVGVLEVLSQYFDVFVMDDKGRTPLFYAALRNHLDCVTLLVGIGE